MSATLVQTLGWLMAVVAGSLVFSVDAAAGAAQGRSAPAAQAAPAARIGSKLEVREIQLRLDELTVIQQGLAGQEKKSALEKIAGQGSEKRQAAETLLRRMAYAQVAATRRTTVVVIGNAADRDKVVASLADVQRPILVLHLDKDARDETFDNTWIRGSLLDKVRAALNMWVYIPKTGGTANDAPEQLHTRLATPLFWKSRFGLDGDIPPLTSDAKKATGAVAPSAPTAPAPTDAAGPDAGQDNVLAARIAGVKILEEPATGSRLLGTLAKGEEVVVEPGRTNGFVKVQTATTTGWVSAALLSSAAGDDRRR